jgi:23S rRNA (cytidine2498-2'-O)-methyltransferase
VAAALPCAVAQCRAGFEPETARDLDALAAHAGATVDIVPAAHAGFVAATARAGAPDLRRWSAALDAAPPVFARSVWFGTGPHAIVPHDARGTRADRVTPLLALAQSVVTGAMRSVWIEYPDTNEGKALGVLARALETRIGAALAAQGRIAANAPQRMHVLLEDGRTAWIGVSDARRGSAWPMGIPRLHMPRAAPSRSTLKLAEAIVTFLGEGSGEALHAGMRAVDLGAAPGGWTWQLTQRGVRVTAVDNGALKGDIAHDALVTHLREDGLRYRPRRPVDWVTCDIVEAPARIAQLMAGWIGEGVARRAIFNLKLPMKKRYDEVLRCRDIIERGLAARGVRGELRMRQLYHDREEVTAYLARTD